MKEKTSQNFIIQAQTRDYIINLLSKIPLTIKDKELLVQIEASINTLTRLPFAQEEKKEETGGKEREAKK